MPYSIIPIIHPYANQRGIQRVLLQVIYNRMKAYKNTDIKVKSNQFKDGIIVAHLMKDDYNIIINNERIRIEKALLQSIGNGKELSKSDLTNIVKNKKATSLLLSDFIDNTKAELQGKKSEDTLRHYSSHATAIEKFRPGINITDFDKDFMNAYEKHVRENYNEPNTVWSKMKFARTFGNIAVSKGLLKADWKQGYKMPSYIQNIPVYLTEAETEAFEKIVSVTKDPAHLIAGNYFLLSCNTGYRISDCKRFNYQKAVNCETIVLRTKKNKTIVSIPIHKKLVPLLQFVKDNPFDLSEAKARQYVKDICRLAGITKDVKFHSGRHTWGMLLTDKGFSLEEVAETLGDTVDIARIYARISNQQLARKIKERLV